MSALAISPTASETRLTVTDLTKRYGDRTVLDGFRLSLRAGEVVSLLGANGSGKSTALRCIAGLVRPDSGSVSMGNEVTRAGAPVPQIAMVFQKIHLVPRRTVLDNVCTGGLGRLSTLRSLGPALFPRSLREEAMACLDRVGLADRAWERAGRLSGGQQQRVAIARALCQRANVVLADEPVSALDPVAADQVMRLLRSLADNDGLAVAAVLHQPDLARTYSDRILGLQGGRISFDLAPAEMGEQTMRDLYRTDYEAEGAVR